MTDNEYEATTTLLDEALLVLDQHASMFKELKDCADNNLRPNPLPMKQCAAVLGALNKSLAAHRGDLVALRTSCSNRR